MSLPFPPLGNDLEALQIHLCRSNLHPRSAARSESTLVSTVSNIYLSQQTRDEPGSCWSLETSRQNYQLAARSLPAERALLCEDDSTDWICHSLQHLHQPVCKRRQISTILFQHLPFVFILLAIFSCAVEQYLIFRRLALHLFKGFLFISLIWTGCRVSVYMCIYSKYCMKDPSPPILKELMHFKCGSSITLGSVSSPIMIIFVKLAADHLEVCLCFFF